TRQRSADPRRVLPEAGDPGDVGEHALGRLAGERLVRLRSLARIGMEEARDHRLPPGIVRGRRGLDDDPGRRGRPPPPREAQAQDVLEPEQRIAPPREPFGDGVVAEARELDLERRLSFGERALDLRDRVVLDHFETEADELVPGLARPREDGDAAPDVADERLLSARPLPDLLRGRADHRALGGLDAPAERHVGEERGGGGAPHQWRFPYTLTTTRRTVLFPRWSVHRTLIV